MARSRPGSAARHPASARAAGTGNVASDGAISGEVRRSRAPAWWATWRELPRPARRGALAIAALALGYLAIFARLLPIGVDDLGIAAVFSADEALSGQIVRQMLLDRTLSPDHFFAYGALYHELAALLLVPFTWLGAGERGALVGLRSVSLLSGAAVIALTYRLGARLYGAWAGMLAAALVALSAELARWSVTAHPDTLQLALITGCLIAVCAVRERPDRGRIALAAALAGLAFGTKYAGVMLLPLIWLASTTALVADGLSGRVLLKRLALDALLIGAVFAFAFAVTNPYALIEWRRFITQMRAELEHAQTGHVLTSEAGGLRWLRVVASAEVAGTLAVLAATAGWVAGLAGLTDARAVPRGAWLRSVATRLGPRGLIAIWTIGYLAYLIIVVGYQEPRYALPLLPGIAVSAAGAVVALGRRWPRLAVPAGVALVALTAVPAAGALADVYRDRLDQRAAEDNPRIAAGRWLDGNVPPEAAVLTDAYVYVPSAFGNQRTTFGLTEAEVSAARPVVIVVNDDIRSRFLSAADRDRYVDGAVAYDERAGTYARLETRNLGCYQLLADLGGVRIYGDRDALRTGNAQGCGAGGS
jgi:4-amino-4-deoxy-L-arabinose transferase-like glycosyltransferase